MKHYKFDQVSDALPEILKDLIHNPDYIVSPRGQEVKEIKDCAVEIKYPIINLYTNKTRSSVEKYIAAELLWYFSGTNNPKFIENYASLWKHLHNEDGTVNSAYGNLIFNEKNNHGVTQYEWAVKSLLADKDTRQAFMHFNKPYHQYLGNKDQVCTFTSLFQIRNDELHMVLNMRSNDVIYGFMTDWAFFSVLLEHMYVTLKPHYPSLKLGSYTHISHSMHIYEKHYKLAEDMLNGEFDGYSTPEINNPIIDERGNIIDEDMYNLIFLPIKTGIIPDFKNLPKFENNLINWCIDKLKY